MTHRPLVLAAASTALLPLSSIPAAAQPQTFERWQGPAEDAVNKRLSALAQQCASEMELSLDYDPLDIITSVDFNDDGTVDAVLDQHKVGCGGSPALWAGTGGSPVRLYVSNAEGGWDEHTTGGFAGRVVVMGHVPVWVQLVHGTACDGAGALPCAEALIWGEGKFRSVADGRPVDPDEGDED